MVLASRGWQKASNRVLDGDHAEHIHAHCDCQFAIAFKPKDIDNYKFYNPQVYKRIYDHADGNTSSEKIENIRKEIDARKKAAENIKNQQLLIEYINEGKISITVDPNRQNKHLYGGSPEGASYFTITIEELQDIINKFHGTGNVHVHTDPNGVIQFKETLTVDHDIGIDILKDGTEENTNSFTIHYSKMHTHAVPSRNKK